MIGGTPAAIFAFALLMVSTVATGLKISFIFLAIPVKSPVKLPKMCRSQKIDFVGSRLRSDCGVGNVFIPLKFDALKTLCLRLNGQNLFHALFTRLKIRVIF